MSKVQIKLDSVQVTDGQGAGEGDFELRLEVQDSSHHIVWPSAFSSTKIDNNGPAFIINQEVGTYTVNSDVTKTFTVLATEVDKGLNGQDDYGTGTVVLDLTPTMTTVSKSTLIDLKRPRMKTNGQVKVTLTASALKAASA